MRKLHEKSIILGVGIGMVITAITGMIFSAGTTKELTKQEIITKAKAFGLIEKSMIMDTDELEKNNNTALDTSANTNSANATDTNAANTPIDEATNTKEQHENSPIKIDERNIEIEIKYANNSEDVIDQLYEKGVISDKKEFEKVLHSYKASTKINVGKFMFKENEDYHYIVKAICRL